MSAVLDQVQSVAKAVMGGLVAAVVAVLFSTVTEPDAVINPDAVPGADQVVQLPNTQAEWVTFVVSVALGFLLPWVKRNFPSVADAKAQVRLAETRVAEGKQDK